MLFNSLHFIFFFPIVVVLYFLIPHRFRWILLVLASYYFYMCWKAEYALILLFATAIDYLLGVLMSRRSEKSERKKFLWISLVMNLGVLFTFKYFNFFSDSIQHLLNQWYVSYDTHVLNLLLPVGISFYTFQSLSYIIEIYRGNIKAEKHFGVFAAYISFFPQLVAGPIERPGKFLPQFHLKHDFNYENMRLGLLQMGWGFFKKLVIADRLAVMVNQVYSHPHEYAGIPLILATYAFAIQIYCDFSGYSNIAIGAARVMGFNLMINFKRPYLSASISEFWQRWHISLSTWFRDYLYIPLGGSKASKNRWMMNILIVFLLSGLWHGANWTFLIWGMYHASLFLIYRILEPIIKLIPRIIMILITFHLVCFGWIFFRSNTLTDAGYIITHLFSGISWKWSGFNMGLGPTETMVAVFFIILMFISERIQERGRSFLEIFNKPLSQRWLVYYTLIFTILIFGWFESSREFIYFKF